MVQSHGFLPAETTPQRESALRESNPPVQSGSLVPLPLGQGHMIYSQGGSRVEATEAAGRVGQMKADGGSPRTAFERCSTTAARAFLLPIGRWSGLASGRMTSFRQAAVTGIEPVSRRLTAARPYQHGLHRNLFQSAWSDLNRRSRAPKARGFPAFPTRC